ncbi:phytoene/squalene synthase family protein [Paenibacillus assamensis]|uniref:phytoene/squalene synthase family protein n=1 Tax=Paenibacillus assamensis TaxID=311244 RepID=UPI00040D131F|nr:phytoene/squalene synthase family protein [Paenibacillus assamensis]
MMELAVCLAKCEAMIKKGSSSFYHAFHLLPRPRREAVFVIYAFCRMIDDAVDEPQPEFTLEELERQFTVLESASGHFIWPSLRWLFAHFPITKEPFFRQMEGQRRDLQFTNYETLDQLEEYCYLVAGSVGEMLLPVLHDNPTKSVVDAGIYLGKAMQIVNVVRDIGEDQARGRRYVPRSLMEKHQYTQEQFCYHVVDERFRAMIEELEQIAGQWFALGLQHLHTYSVESAMSVELAAKYYGAILGKVRQNDYNVFTKRAIVGPFDKIEIFKEVSRAYSKDALLQQESSVVS